MPPGRADREDGALDTVISELKDNEHRITSDIRRWRGTGGARASNRLVQQGAPGHPVSWTPANITHLNPARGEAGSRRGEKLTACGVPVGGERVREARGRWQII